MEDNCFSKHRIKSCWIFSSRSDRRPARRFFETISSISNYSFTLLEVVIVVGIVIVLAGAAVLVLNPVEYIRQGRDTARQADLDSLQTLVAEVKYEGKRITTLGSPNMVYVSLADSTSTCANLSLPSLAAGWSYSCVTEANLRNIDGTGWLPVNVSEKKAFGTLPIDPTNDEDYYYAYALGTGGNYALTALFESEKKLKDVAAGDEGADDARYEVGVGSNIWNQASGLVGYWPLDEGSGGYAYDESGNDNLGTLVNGPSWVTSENCRIKKCLSFDGSNDYVSVTDAITSESSGGLTISLWFKGDVWAGFPVGYANFFDRYYTPGTGDKIMIKKYGTQYSGDRKLKFRMTLGSNDYIVSSNSILTDTNWHHIAGTWDGTTMRMYLDGNPQSQTTVTAESTYSSNRPVGIGRANDSSEYFDGSIDETRFYARSLSEAEIQALYKVGR
ncbi:hypothetical protein A2755_00750 [Candidatus Wolfebacteria bacterium RIFCSPHIGHO2_01_FULL_48_22]|uniref:LamG-like jellyroll fold domain-containing protein n=2 Tax=Candidatus Wolfeibacteriota TaxID=1752735 RepID=A0A1F8DV69_9BACT|nr:MAG: hypothetical protein A2755_00750 [Candidatus Wolfebacteria bacterium RIFCSPHIGHO2_01_FULL_48_22]OGM93544.1 MAG: hypothetical protein A2935_02860 [Candidatus Wolfebacteria bacterium RIFCSPLOWO2_01_FULL_47_17b]